MRGQPNKLLDIDMTCLFDFDIGLNEAPLESYCNAARIIQHDSIEPNVSSLTSGLVTYVCSMYDFYPFSFMQIFLPPDGANGIVSAPKQHS